MRVRSLRRILVDGQTRDEVAVVDPRSLRLVRRLALPGCDRPHGLDVDAPRRLAFVACDENARLVTLDLRRMRATNVQTVGSSPDVLAFDPGLRGLYVAAESGEVSVRRARQTPRGARSGLPRRRGAHTAAVDPSTHLVYFPLERGSKGAPQLRVMAPVRR